jgi:hypothetical protein
MTPKKTPAVYELTGTERYSDKRSLPYQATSPSIHPHELRFGPWPPEQEQSFPSTAETAPPAAFFYCPDSQTHPWLPALRLRSLSPTYELMRLHQAAATAPDPGFRCIFCFPIFRYPRWPRPNLRQPLLQILWREFTLHSEESAAEASYGEEEWVTVASYRSTEPREPLPYFGTRREPP